MSLPVFEDDGRWWARTAPWPFHALDRWAADYWRQHTTPEFKRNARKYGR